MRIYYSSKGKSSEANAKAALYDYIGIRDELVHGEDGHPLFASSDVKISISHSEDYWVCVLSDEDAGIDIEKIKNRNWEKIAKRYFTETEKETVRKSGVDGFYRVWTAKEACAKKNHFGVVNILNKDVEGVEIRYIDIDSRYVMCICADNIPDKVEIKGLD